MKPIDHAEASSHFTEAKAHLEFHDRRLWDLRVKRDRHAYSIPADEIVALCPSALVPDYSDTHYWWTYIHPRRR